MEYSGTTATNALPADIVDNVVQFSSRKAAELATLRLSDACLLVALQKIFDIEFVAPLDVPTGLMPDNETLKARYWTVFKPDAFADPAAAAPSVLAAALVGAKRRGARRLASVLHRLGLG